MAILSPELLKSCDIRGIYPKPLGLLQAEEIGLAVGTQIKNEGHLNIKVVVGHDIRLSGEALKKALLHGLRSTGLKIVDAGQVSTPLLAYATRFAKASLGIMVTASHNPPDHNGFKFFTQGTPAPVSWIDRLYQVLNSRTYRKGAGVIEKKEFYADYRNALANTVARNFQHLKVVVDVGNGAAALTVPMVLKALNIDAVILNSQPDGRFPGRGADSSSPRALEPLGERVRKEKAKLGFSFDGDADRVSFVDENGREVPNEVILGLFVIELSKSQKKPKVVYDTKCSDVVEKMALLAEGTALLEKAGHSFIYERMLAEKAQLAGEASGHFFLPGDFPGDALFASLRVMKLLKDNKGSFSQMFSFLPERISTHDIHLQVPLESAGKLFASFMDQAQAMGGQVSTIDGVRAVFDEGWGIVRKSVTEPVLSCRLEAQSSKKLKFLAEGLFKEYPDILQLVLEKIKFSSSSSGS